jgi:hypothetical protein
MKGLHLFASPISILQGWAFEYDKRDYANLGYSKRRLFPKFRRVGALHGVAAGGP